MQSNVNQSPESSPQPPDELEEITSQIANKREQIATLKREIARLDQKRREVQRQQAQPIPSVPVVSVNEQPEAQNSSRSLWLKFLLAAVAFTLAGLGQY